MKLSNRLGLAAVAFGCGWATTAVVTAAWFKPVLAIALSVLPF